MSYGSPSHGLSPLRSPFALSRYGNRDPQHVADCAHAFRVRCPDCDATFNVDMLQRAVKDVTIEAMNIARENAALREELDEHRRKEGP